VQHKVMGPAANDQQVMGPQGGALLPASSQSPSVREGHALNPAAAESGTRGSFQCPSYWACGWDVARQRTPSFALACTAATVCRALSDEGRGFFAGRREDIAVVMAPGAVPRCCTQGVLWLCGARD